jgi:hypothetical protein
LLQSIGKHLMLKGTFSALTNLPLRSRAVPRITAVSLPRRHWPDSAAAAVICLAKSSNVAIYVGDACSMPWRRTKQRG